MFLKSWWQRSCQHVTLCPAGRHPRVPRARQEHDRDGTNGQADLPPEYFALLASPPDYQLDVYILKTAAHASWRLAGRLITDNTQMAKSPIMS